MDELRGIQAAMEIHVVKLDWLASRRTQVFVDDQVVGTLAGGGAPSFPISAGVHRVRLKHSFAKSQTLEVSWAPGERVALECGVRIHGAPAVWPLMVILWFPLAWMPIALPLGLPILPATDAAAQITLLFVFFWNVWRWQLSPGSCIYLKLQGAPEEQRGAKHPFWRLPQITIRRAMIMVAALALFLAVGIQEWKWQRHREFQREAERHRDQESSYRLKSALPFLSNAQKASYERLAEYHARMRQKYLQAASDPWTPVEEEPEPP